MVEGRGIVASLLAVEDVGLDVLVAAGPSALGAEAVIGGLALMPLIAVQGGVLEGADGTDLSLLISTINLSAIARHRPRLSFESAVRPAFQGAFDNAGGNEAAGVWVGAPRASLVAFGALFVLKAALLLLSFTQHI